MKRSVTLALWITGSAVALPAAGTSASDIDPRSPEQVFATRCAYCHEAGGWGTRTLARRMPESEAILLERGNLPPAYTEYVLRRGLRSMPAFNPSELTDTELQNLAQWLEDRN